MYVTLFSSSHCSHGCLFFFCAESFPFVKHTQSLSFSVKNIFHLSLICSDFSLQSSFFLIFSIFKWKVLVILFTCAEKKLYLFFVSLSLSDFKFFISVRVCPSIQRLLLCLFNRGFWLLPLAGSLTFIPPEENGNILPFAVS